ncbi:MAG: hypothetical protein HUU57_12625 [Bdellovibrio sp.]|nr:hypothetical protein [Bdellovibrio sp.]
MLVNKLICGALIFILISCATSKEIVSSVPSEKTKIPDLKPPEGVLTIADITVGKSTLIEASQKFHGGEVHKSGDAGASVRRLCYIGKDGTALTLESGEMGGQAGLITSAKLSLSKELPYKRNCSKNAAISQKTAFKQGLGLSKPSHWVRETLGTPTKETSDSVFYFFQNTEKDGEKSKEVLSTIEVKTLNGKVIEASVFQVAERY